MTIFSSLLKTKQIFSCQWMIAQMVERLLCTRDLQTLTLAGPTVTRPVPDPLAVLSLDNRLYIIKRTVENKGHEKMPPIFKTKNKQKKRELL